MIDLTYILKRQKKINGFIGNNFSEIPDAIIDQLTDFHNEMIHLIIALDKEKQDLKRFNDYLWNSRKQIAEMFIEENNENAERNIKQINWFAQKA